MASLADFPAEILGQIFRGLPQTDLASLCKANSTLRQAAVPLLYESIRFVWTEKNVPPIIRFLRTILTYPDLALHVRHLELLGSTFHQKHEPRISTPKIPVDSDSIGPLIGAIESLRLPYESSWVDELRAGTMDAFTALLVARVPKLRRLRVEGNFSQDARFSGNLLRSALCDHDGTGLPGFKHLHTVVSKGSLSRERTFDFPNTENVLPLFYLAGLRHLEVVIDTPRSGGPIQWPAGPPILSNLTSLELWMLRETSLEQVLRATPCLKSLTWHWLYSAVHWERPWAQTINLEMVASALGCVRDTLETLKIFGKLYMGYNSIEYDPMEMRGNLLSLSTFQLKTLQMPWPFFVGFSIDYGLQFRHVVPTSVEHLILSESFEEIDESEWEEEEMHDRLLEYLGDLQPSEAHLRSLHILTGSYPLSYDWTAGIRPEKIERMQRLTDACSEHQVEFMVRRE
ncbi:hypothetical protein LX36DRAFT_660930 [Colletotrichum falcatum]|nr:hypothetical protein LX36DRAFT_660930 [Colletotrichum falcatum]